ALPICGNHLGRGRMRSGYCPTWCERRLDLPAATESNQQREHRARPRPRVPAKCIGCGAEFMALKQTGTGEPGKYCSVKCCAAHAKATGKFRGANNPRWLGG